MSEVAHKAEDNMKNEVDGVAGDDKADELYVNNENAVGDEKKQKKKKPNNKSKCDLTALCVTNDIPSEWKNTVTKTKLQFSRGKSWS